MMDLNDMLYFAEVVERGGFASAGRALGTPSCGRNSPCSGAGIWNS